MQDTIGKLKDLQDKAFAEENFTELEKFFQTAEYKELPYLIRNRGFITSHKMLEFMRCQFCYAQKYINEVPDPTEGDNDNFLIGQALDDRLTEGEDFFKSNYEVVARRSDKAVKKQLTMSQGSLVNNMQKEFMENKLFNKKPAKKIFFAKIGGFILKAELDDFVPGERIMNDVKSTANITTFDPHNYLHQMSFYQLVVEESQDVRCAANLEVVDKYSAFSRSALYHFTQETLFSGRGGLLQALEEMRSAHDSGIFVPAKDQATLFTCPYYGLKTNSCSDGHGRPTKPIIF